MPSIINRLAAGQTLLRILMNRGFAGVALAGKVIDVGGGRAPDYFDYFDTSAVESITPLDGSISGVDFEKDPLPLASNSAGSLVCANLLEHVYNHRLLIGEMYRVLAPEGVLAGFVPFLMQYHPDPHDYFRYTKEALRRLFADAGFTRIEITEIGGGPFLVNFNNLVLSVPRLVALILYPFYAFLDSAFLALRPRARERYPLGYVFIMHKP